MSGHTTLSLPWAHSTRPRQHPTEPHDAKEKCLEERQADLSAPEHLQFICLCQPGSLITLMSCLSFTQRKSPLKITSLALLTGTVQVTPFTCVGLVQNADLHLD